MTALTTQAAAVPATAPASFTGAAESSDVPKLDASLVGKSKEFIKVTSSVLLCSISHALLLHQGVASTVVDSASSDLLDFLSQLGLQGLYYKVL
jgi:hypothetical protein